MTKHFRAALLIAVLTLSVLTGCAVRAIETPHTERPTQTVPVSRDIPAESAPSAVVSTEPAARLTTEQAQAIALNHAGFTADQVRFLRTEPELRDRVPHYDVEFAEGRWEYDYEIHAETGAVLSFEKDD